MGCLYSDLSMGGEKPNFIQQLMQRRVMRSISLYLVSAFVILQVADITFEPLGLPTWVMQALIVMLVAGLPATAILAWVFDLTRDGVVRTGSKTDLLPGPSFTTARKIEVVVIVLLGVALAWFMWTQSGGANHAPSSTVNRSVAVLPFASLGGEDHLALGLTNELTSTLSIIPDLHVASFSFAALGQLASDMEIAQALKVEHLVKGTVQQANEQLRVTAQVVRARDGKVLWSLTQDRALTDIFTIQDEIATNVAVNLKSTLYREALAASAATRTDNLGAYQAYLQALRHGGIRWHLAAEHAHRAVSLDPDFVPAITLLAQAYLTRLGGSIPFNEAHPLAQNFAQQALQLAPDYPPALIVQAHLQRMARNYEAAERLFRRAKELAPNRPTLDLANFLRMRGDLNAALQEYEHSVNIDPLYLGMYGHALFAKGLYNRLFALHEPIARSGTVRTQSIAATNLALWHAHLGHAPASDRWLEYAMELAQQTDSTTTIGVLSLVLHKVGRQREAAAYLAQLEELASRQYVSPAGLFWAYYGAGDLQRAFIALNRAVDENVLILLMELKTSPLLDDLRDDLRFITVLDRLGLNDT